MLYRALELEGAMRYWRKEVAVHALFIDFKEQRYSSGICMFQHTRAIIRPLWFAFWGF
jgi:hypothetical protein